MLVAALTVAAVLCIPAASQDDAGQENTAAYWSQMGDRYVMNNSLLEAVQAYDRALEIEPENESLWISKSLSYQMLSQQASRAALNIIDRKLEKNPQDALAWQARGVALAGLEMIEDSALSFEKAVEIYDQELQSHPDNATAWWFKAENLANLGRSDQALPAYEKVIDLGGPRTADAWFARGSILMRQGDYNQSLASYDKVIELRPDDYLGWLGKAYVLTSMGNSTGAEEAYATARSLGYRY
ncbi:MAG: tetratricopeptide repeat protein [Methanosarcinales archaeon]|nr:tetratricopeptide repeat protein [Methanosarcinales archaeon]